MMEDKRQVVVFKCGEEEFAIDIQKVKEIILPPSITRIPKSPDYIKGVINLRGIMIPVISLSRRLGKQDSEFTDDSRIIIITIEDIYAGITVDSVTEVIYLEEKDIEKTDLVYSVDSQFIEGVEKTNNRLLILLNLEEVLDLDSQN